MGLKELKHLVAGGESAAVGFNSTALVAAQLTAPAAAKRRDEETPDA